MIKNVNIDDSLNACFKHEKKPWKCNIKQNEIIITSSQKKFHEDDKRYINNLIKIKIQSHINEQGEVEKVTLNNSLSVVFKD